MGSHPLNLACRFLLEIIALSASCMWGWKQSEGKLKFILAIGIPIVLAAIWSTFAVPDDASRSGLAPIATPGFIRIVIELGIFSFAAWSLYDMGYDKASLAFSIIVIVHYAISYDRILWLLTQ